MGSQGSVSTQLTQKGYHAGPVRALPLLAGAYAAPQFLVGGHSGLVHPGGLAHAGGLVHAGGFAHAGGLVHAGPVLHATPLVHSIARPVAVAGAYAAADPLAEVSPYTFNYAVSDDYSGS